MPDLAKAYDPQGVQDKWYDIWENTGLFHAVVDQDRTPYSITIPPPNVTGSLHVGHALCYTIHDALVRWRRMHGYETLCLPGSDHAGIATQNAVERELAREGLSRHDLGREKFVERVWEFKERSGGTIFRQFRTMGYGFDWDRTRFTLDEGYYRAVIEHFVKLYEEGHIYRGARVINWCPRCSTAISDIEIEYDERQAELYHFDYPFEDGSGHVTIATTRPETMLGDTAVAVNPRDERYAEVVGKHVVLPVVGRRLPIVADDYADPEFGTGALKVTPAHDPNDFEIARRHGLESVTVIKTDATMSEQAGRYAGMDRYECRKALLEELKQTGALNRVEPYSLSINTCARCHTAVEPLLLDQWFVSMERLAPPAAEAVRDGRVQFVPDRFAKTYLNWMDNIRDWCISRQLWWGHRIPAYYCLDCNAEKITYRPDQDASRQPEDNIDWGKTDIADLEVVVSRERPSGCPRCGGARFAQDPDVLDTWFSSALWTFATMGWPDKTPELEFFHPTSVLITARDIIYLWVARMIMSSLYFLDEVPFRKVFIYATVMNQDGQRMSKSLGTGADPLEIVDTYGVDALRFALLEQTGKNQDMRFPATWLCQECGVTNSSLVPHTGKCRSCGSDKVKVQSTLVEQSRNFANKIWNASRFVLMNVGDSDLLGGEPSREHLRVQDRWIVSRLARTIKQVNDGFENFDIDVATKSLYEFIWGDYCDWYVELAKPRLRTEEAPAVRSVLVGVLETILRLLHPVMPFLTEEIWHALPAGARPTRAPSIMVAPYATLDPRMIDEQAEQEMAAVQEVVTRARNLRAEARVAPGKKVSMTLAAEDDEWAALAERNRSQIQTLAQLESLEIITSAPDTKALTAQTSAGTLMLSFGSQADVDRETERLSSERAGLEAEVKRASGKLSNPGFLAKAPADVVAKQQAIVEELGARIREIDERLALLS